MNVQHCSPAGAAVGVPLSSIEAVAYEVVHSLTHSLNHSLTQSLNNAIIDLLLSQYSLSYS